MHSTPRILVTTLLAAGLALAPVHHVRACENDDEERGGEVVGTEILESDVDLVLTPQAKAAYAGKILPSGKAFLSVYNDQGVNTATLDAQIFGLADGEYVITSTSFADGKTVTVLGTLTLAPEEPDPILEEDDDVTDNDGDHPEVEGKGGRSQHRVATVRIAKSKGSANGEGEVEDEDPQPNEDEDTGPDIGEDSYFHFGGENSPFPDGFNPLDIGVVTLSTADTTDANGVTVPGIPVLTADFGAANTDFEATVTVEDEDDANVTGTALIRAKMKNKKKLAQRFSLLARGLPKNAPVTVTFNDGKSINARTTRKGTLGLTKLPPGVNAFRLHKVEIKSKPTRTAAQKSMGMALF